MIKRIASLFSVLAMLLVMGTFAFGQETTGTIEVTVKDPNGAVVPNVAVTITSSGDTAGFRRNVTTDDNGFQRVLAVPPGTYSVMAAATAGFKERNVTDVVVSLGRTTPVTIELSTTVSGDVTITETDTPPIDPTDSKIQTTINAQQAELLPKGTNFASLLKLSPATRVEPLSGQFQIDGSSGSENTFIIDGQEVTNARTGVLNSNSNLPFQLVQEFQVKSSGFEAEYGGATGGVINVVTRGGSNVWRGEFGAQFRPSRLQAVGRPALFLNTSNAAEYYPAGHDNYLGFYPTANLGGPIIKNYLWFNASYTPQIFTRNRSIAYLDSTTRVPTGAVENYRAKEVDEYAFLRMDGQLFDKVRLTGTYTYNPISVRGAIPTYLSALDVVPTNPAVGLTGDEYINQTGGRQNSQSVTGQIQWFPTSNFSVNARAGHYFLNEKLGSYGIGDIASTPRQTCSASSPLQFPANFGCLRGQGNGLGLDIQTNFDATERNTFDADATFIFSGGGRHQLKGGYQYNGLANQLSSVTRDQIVLRFGQPVNVYSGVAAIIPTGSTATNPTGLCSSPTYVPNTPCNTGAGLLRQFREQGDVSSKNEALYIQDKWQPFNRLTLNLGVRVERENVPSFEPTAPDLQFDFMDKIAPRIGGAFDLFGDGKTKVAAFYGWFYDRFKYELPRGSFGGQFFHDFYFEMLPGDTLASLTAGLITGGGVPTPGGLCPTTGQTPIFGRVRCDFDFRVPSNAGLGLEFGAVDPDIKAFRQSEFTVSLERDLGHNLVLSGRYTRKQVDRTIEDAGFQNAAGSEAYVIGNPGRGLYRQLAEDAGYRGDLKPQRQYDALEVRLDRRFANNFFFQANYTFSRLYGNYSGLASSDEDGRLSPNVNRFFDLPHAGYTVAGGPDNGRLPTDRPHVFKFYGAYVLDWNDRFGFQNHSTDFKLFTTVQSGTPVTSVVDIYSIDTIVLTKRGDLGRTETFTGTDFAISHRYRFGRDNRFTLVADLDILNIFNEANETNRQNLINITNYDLTATNIGLITPADPTSAALRRVLAIRRFQEGGAPNLLNLVNTGQYPLYNKSSAFQGPREFRFGFRLLF
jgi:hypothetical protein